VKELTLTGPFFFFILSCLRIPLKQYPFNNNTLYRITKTSACLLFLFLSSFQFSGYAQEGIPIIKRFSVENYQAGLENWDAVQDDNGIMYFANSEGVLEFDGVHWKLLQTSFRTTIRCLSKSPEGDIYLGGDSEMGYLQKDVNGQKKFISLLNNCPKKYRHFTHHVWKIIIYKGKKIFLANGAVLIFDEQNNFVKILEEQIYLRSLFLIDDTVYAYSNKKGILVLNSNTLSFSSFSTIPFITNRSLEFIDKHPEGGLRFHIYNDGFYTLHNQKLSKEILKNSGELNANYIFCHAKSKEILFLGTTTNGLFGVSENGLSNKYHFDKSVGINDNKVFALFKDHDDNIWLCHENGLSYIEINSPVRLLTERLGVHGTGHCTVVYGKTLFAGTSHGLFASSLSEKNAFYKFNLFKLVREPIYFLETKEDKLLIGGLLEIFEWDGKNLKSLYKSRNNNKIKALPNNPNWYLISNENGFLLAHYTKGFQIVRKMEGIDSEIKDFTIDKFGKIWIINSEYELIVAALNENMSVFKIQKQFRDQDVKQFKYFALSTFNKKIILATNKGLYSCENDRNVLSPVMAEQDSLNYVVNWLYNENNKDLWYEKTYFNDGKLFYQIDVVSSDNKSNQATSLNSAIYGDKAFSFGHLNSGELAIGTSVGFLVYNLKYDLKKLQQSEAYIRKITVANSNDTTIVEGIWVGNNNTYELPLQEEFTNIELDCGSNYFYSHDNVNYSFKMKGIDQDWTKWTKDNKILYSISGDGTFIFHVKAASNYSSVSHITSYTFVIKKPWYKSVWWYLTEIGILGIIMAISIYYNRKGSNVTSRVSAVVLVLLILTAFEIMVELIQDLINAESVTVFAFKIAINIFIALSISPAESWLRSKLIVRTPKVIKAKG
jgi:ligand-binding sensor domain-containing protein